MKLGIVRKDGNLRTEKLSLLLAVAKFLPLASGIAEVLHSPVAFEPVFLMC
jgi:hypothetical protein